MANICCMGRYTRLEHTMNSPEKTKNQEKTLRTVRPKIILALLSVVLATLSCRPQLAVDKANSLKITEVHTDKRVYQKYDMVTFVINIKNSGNKPVRGMWVDVWIDKMPISIINTDKKYQDQIYIKAWNYYKCLTAFMPDPNPSYNPVPNEFVPGPIEPGAATTVNLSYQTTGEYTRIQNYTTKVYEWDPALGKNLDGMVMNHKKVYGESDLAVGSFALEGVKAVSSYPDGSAAAFVMRIDDVGRNSAEVEKLTDIMNRHNAKGTFMVISNGVEYCRDALANALSSGHEVGVHGLNHICQFPRSAHIPETLATEQASPPYWHEFEGPHFEHNSYADQFKRIKHVCDQIVSNLNVKPLSFCAPQVAFSEVTFKAARDIGLEYSSNLVGAQSELAYCDLVEVPYIGDYTWDVAASNYDLILDAARKDFDRISAEGGVMVMIVHAIRMNALRYEWLDDFLSYLDTKKVWRATVKDVGAWYKRAEKKPVPVTEIPGGPEYIAR